MIEVLKINFIDDSREPDYLIINNIKLIAKDSKNMFYARC